MTYAKEFVVQLGNRETKWDIDDIIGAILKQYVIVFSFDDKICSAFPSVNDSDIFLKPDSLLEASANGNRVYSLSKQLIQLVSQRLSLLWLLKIFCESNHTVEPRDWMKPLVCLWSGESLNNFNESFLNFFFTFCDSFKLNNKITHESLWNLYQKLEVNFKLYVSTVCSRKSIVVLLLTMAFYSEIFRVPVNLTMFQSFNDKLINSPVIKKFLWIISDSKIDKKKKDTNFMIIKHVLTAAHSLDSGCKLLIDCLSQNISDITIQFECSGFQIIDDKVGPLLYFMGSAELCRDTLNHLRDDCLLPLLHQVKSESDKGQLQKEAFLDSYSNGDPVLFSPTSTDCFSLNLQSFFNFSFNVSEASFLDVTDELLQSIYYSFHLVCELMYYDRLHIKHGYFAHQKKFKNQTTYFYPTSKVISNVISFIESNIDCKNAFTSYAFVRIFLNTDFYNRLLELETYTQYENEIRRIPKTVKGTIDSTSTRILIIQKITCLARQIFQLYGGVELDTPVFELKELLTQKYGEDEKLIYDLEYQGGEKLALRYDLTVPFARFLACNKILQMKRFQIGKVYRRDEPQIKKGRYREFIQCDIDFAGMYSPMVPDVELILALCDFFDCIKPNVGEFRIHINHRSLLYSILHVSNIKKDQIKTVTASLDKFDKISWKGVESELKKKGITQESIDMIHYYINPSVEDKSILDWIQEKINFSDANLKQYQDGLTDLRLLFSYMNWTKFAPNIHLNLSLARGLDYYTGIIFEFELIDHHEVGSVAAGGRYDNLVKDISGFDVPCIGGSIGVERIVSLLEKYINENKIDAQNIKQEFSNNDLHNLTTSPTQVYICTDSVVPVEHKMELCSLLRANKISTSFSYKSKLNLKKQLGYASDMGIPIAIIYGENELLSNTFNIRILNYDALNNETNDDNIFVMENIQKDKLLDIIKTLTMKYDSAQRKCMKKLFFSSSATLNQFPLLKKSNGEPYITYKYGTCGFRFQSIHMPYVVVRCACYLSYYMHNENNFIGVCVTASHNPSHYNGIKIFNSDGSFFSKEQCHPIELFMNSSDPVNFLENLKVQNNTNGDAGIHFKKTIILGTDNRDSSDFLSKILRNTLELLNVHYIDLKYVPTAALQYLVAYHEKIENADSARALYNSFLRTGIMSFLQNVNEKKNLCLSSKVTNIIIDTSNGIASYTSDYLLEILKNDMKIIPLLINNCTSADDIINHKCGSEYVCKEQCLPVGLNKLLVNEHTSCCSFDGDADRLVYYLPRSKSEYISLNRYKKVLSCYVIDGNNIQLIILRGILDMLDDCVEKSQKAASFRLTIGVVIGRNINQKLLEKLYDIIYKYNYHDDIVVSYRFAETGFGYFYDIAKEYSIGLAFENNGHGTVLYSKNQLQSWASEKHIIDLSCYKTLQSYLNIFNPIASDAFCVLLATEAILKYFEMSPSDLIQLYPKNTYYDFSITSSRQSLDIIKINPFNEQSLLQPSWLYYKLKRIYQQWHRKCKIIIRPSGTEEICRIYIESLSHKDVVIIWKNIKFLLSFLNTK